MLVVGCSKPINDEALIDKDGLKYHPDTKELYSGDVFKNYLGGKTEYEGSYKYGKQDGKWTWWYENGQKKSEQTYKDGKEDGLHTQWYENGQKRIEGNYRNGEHTDIWTSWDSLGVEHSASDWFNKGYDAKEYDKKISFYEKAIEIKPDYAAAYINLGNAYYDQGKLELQISNYKKAARLGHQGCQDWLKKNGYDW